MGIGTWEPQHDIDASVYERMSPAEWTGLFSPGDVVRIRKDVSRLGLWTDLSDPDPPGPHRILYSEKMITSLVSDRALPPLWLVLNARWDDASSYLFLDVVSMGCEQQARGWARALDGAGRLVFEKIAL